MSRSQQGLSGAGEWHQFKSLFPELRQKRTRSWMWLRLALQICCGMRCTTGAGDRLERKNDT